jgi:3-dehydroquinate synthase
MIHKISVKIAAKPTIHYPILIGANLFDLAILFPLQQFNKIVIITDNVVKKNYGLLLNNQLKKTGHDCLLLSFSSGDKFKNNTTKKKIETAMLLHCCSQDTLIVALGGGVVGDLAGFIAATFLRGVPYVQIPTTLLAMVDSSIGGKTGINTPQGKNLIGAIYQPQCVIADVRTLKTLSKKARINGLIEAIKMFLTHDAKSFHYTVSHLTQIVQGEESLLKKIIARAVKIKTRVVERDETEKGERALLNFGHTIGHALEKISNYKLLHGYAVAYGILVEATISHLLGFLDEQQLITIKNLMSKLDIYGKDLKKFNITQLLQATRNDKKVRLNNVHYTLLQKIGSAHISQKKYTHPVPDKIVKQAFKLTIAEGQQHVR